ncbi:MAG TPA: ABC transporter permease [Thermoanaerobaculia bacterium]|nr:ABC transporter permease [Thermoanaerobaculia bacterium]
MRRAGPRRLFRFPLRGQVEQDVDTELQFHLAMRIDDLIDEGMTPAAAREEALRRFGDLGTITNDCREIDRRREKEMWWIERWTELRQDLAYAFRQMVKAPVFTLIAILTLALGIGATTAIFSVLDAVVLRPLPYPKPGRLMRIWERNPQTDQFSVSDPNYLDWRAANRSFKDMAAIRFATPSLTGDGEPVRLTAAAVTASLFPVLGAKPALGRAFLPEEDRPGGATQVAVLSHPLWQSRFGADPGILGRTLHLEGQSYTVIGVMPADFAFPDWAELWIPLAPDPAGDRTDKWLDVVGRLKPGVTVEQARADLDAVARRLAERYPDANRDWGAHAVPFPESIVGPQVTQTVLVLFSAVGLLLLMACVNVSNLLLARATVRGREMGLRSALGAGRARLIRQLLTESVLLAGCGAVAGLGVAYAAVRLLRAFGPADVPRLDEVSLDGRVLAFTLLTALVTGLLFGLAPALQASRIDLYALLQQGGRAAMAAGRRLRDALVVGELAMAMMLLIGAGLMIGSFLRLQQADTGFDMDGVLTVQLELPEQEYPAERRHLFFSEVQERIAALPGVRAAGATNTAPFGSFHPTINFSVEGREPQGPEDFLSADWRSVTPGFFHALGIPLRRGRLLNDADRKGTPDVVAITQTMADRLWPGEDPIGRRIHWGGLDGGAVTIVGVVGDVRDLDITEDARNVLFLPYQQIPWPQMTLLIKTAGPQTGLTAAIRREIRAVDGDLPIPEVQPLRQSLSNAVAAPRFRMLLFGIFAAVALVLATIGVYGVMMFAVAQRTREIGVRLALGARPWGVVRLVLRRGLLLTLLGIALGWTGAFALTRFLASLLYGTAPTDAATFAAVALLLAGVATAAGYLPARRAAAIDPRLAFSAN